MHITKTTHKHGKKQLWLVIGDSAFRMNRILFSAVMLIAAFFLIWPGYTFFSSATPFIIGLPLSFAWVILWVIIGFAAMLSLYISDNKDSETD